MKKVLLVLFMMIIFVFGMIGYTNIDSPPSVNDEQTESFN
ncbi:hypothetical protein SAMN04490247_2066 [Salimicrobium halophilum]|uniref:Uncharacterized protein n=1 Tax=Salimicrobium halophilum TaxID=86666 RepID=A0A1G8U663_9BACI|nr:hypothetical protein SAMN04490247_2066 [Salimicrobium halophilum]